LSYLVYCGQKSTGQRKKSFDGNGSCPILLSEGGSA
jgi:hypothetical protein